jgi:outer membrane lipoprotein SlyB
MNTNVIRRTHPILIIAALAVTLFSAAGTAALLGWLPASTGQTPAQPLLPVTEAKPVAPIAQAPEAAALKPVRKPKPAAPRYVAADPAPTPYYEAPVSSPPAVLAQAPAVIEPPKPVCNDCGVIEAVFANKKQDAPSGAGAAAGGVLGGVLGHQVGNGRGRDLMTVVGAVGGAIAGHQIEKSRRVSTSYEIVVRLDDGTTQRFTQAEQPAWRSGDRVRVVNGAVRSI